MEEILVDFKNYLSGLKGEKVKRQSREKKISKKLVSVIIPIYNSEKYLHRCVDSILSQTYKNIEVILVDDGSPDNCPKICDEYAQKDKRIKVIHKKNGGAGSARNQGIDLAKGEFIQFVDSDDFIKFNMVEKFVSKIKDNDVIICGYEYYRNNVKIGEQKTEESNFYIKENKKLFLEVIGKYTFTPVNKLYRKEIIPYFNENHKFGEDFEFNIEYFKKCNKILIIADTPYIYNVDTPNSLTKSNKDKYLNLFKSVYDNLVEFNKVKLKNCYGIDFIYTYIFENLTGIMINSLIFQKNKPSFLKTFLEDGFVKEIIKKVKYKGKSFLNRIKIFLLKRKYIKLYIFLVNRRKKFYQKNFIN